MKAIAFLTGALALAGCSAQRAEVARADAPVTVKVIAFNDFHGNLETPGRPIDVQAPDGSVVKVPAGGAAYFATAVQRLKARATHSVVVAAGDLTSASPLTSSLFLDEPTVTAMNMIGLEINAAGNHEFDRGTAELLRLQKGGCEKLTNREPCQLEPFKGAAFTYLAGNTVRADGGSLLPGTTIKTFGSGRRAIKIGFIGLTTRMTSTYVDPAGIRGYRFADEAETANKLVPQLKAQGADAIVVLIHEGGYPKRSDQPNQCDGLTGEIIDIVKRLDPAVDLVVSGHTHKAYVCDFAKIDAARPVLLTSAGNYGAFVTYITLTFDPVSRKLTGKTASQVVVQGEGNLSAAGPVKPAAAFPALPADPAVAAHVARYAAAAGPRAKRVVGRASAPILRDEDSEIRESPLGLLIADAQLAATRKDGAQLSLMNPGGVRTSITPAADGTVTFGDLYAVQPFGNNLQVKEYSGAQLRAVLEQQFTNIDGPRVLFASGLSYSFDRSRPAGQRIIAPLVEGKPLRDEAVYRVAMSGFLGGGGDAFDTLAAGKVVAGGVLDLDALEAWFARGQVIDPPALGRVKDVTPAGWKAN
ncbi:bifunctional metallophosphatase/5'-nucleotidase [Sphingomonas sp. MG17]|uniref:Bifunctional metallophosphatase/5'-nucleotidase n=1 Tax=Sphingomonas tagetis TaxID=2949092 RepID=A0A9X2HIE2_9SPHN|nr:bifunctional metallophosphatase/5'-nucleotidase [Sphingomonas tagetis]MCP3730517.1 bifunctional metallophosphatase/5'-nucleotidase [Sphingomonas tagetis]